MHTLPSGYRLATVKAGFRKEARDDLALLVSDAPAALAGVFTTNIFKAAPVLVGMETVRARRHARAVLVNSGRANACTGDEGIVRCRATLEMVAKAAGLQAHEILPMSTGVIGEQLRLELWEKAVPELARKLGAADLEAFARAIMTTDAFPKFATTEVRLSGGVARLCGAAKGAGMICPNMATMLAVLFCDAAVDPEPWREMFRCAADATFNRVSVDGDTSTNDALIGLANGASGVAVRQDEHPLLEEAVRDLLGKISYMLVQDGEGATKVMHIRIRGAASNEDAELVARAVGHSPLVKTAMFGRDPNWGRIAAAAGRSGASFKAENTHIWLCGVQLIKNGQPIGVDVDAVLTEPLEQRDIHIEIELGAGEAEYLFLASDLGHAYVTCNADYRS
ncbi:MAG: bifunctional glutamate N-acetyltransferase/amino-acid acetyltransferase ArgJ [Deltaproteobacteria bacterium]|jgi:glutamate N-acetyltransferase/amino-acid N-acetyltransferase|nr:bifunctional glutamate N-acetyltransferase/amino-acid acetyltransferase ArgJ [Deltaproteobacteria bacterium]